MELYCVEQLPVMQNRMFQTRQEAIDCIKADIVLVQDSSTGLIYNRAFRPELVTYDGSYDNEQGLSAAFKEHLNEVASLFKRHFAHCSLLEIGCGKGTFLEKLRAIGYDIVGYDPSYTGNSPHIQKDVFDQNSRAGADGIILRHVLEHIANPLDFLIKLRECSHGSGRIYIEVPCFDWICSHRAWFDVFYEHVNYFRLKDLQRMFGRVFGSGHLFGGQYIYIVGDLATVQELRATSDDVAAMPNDFSTGIMSCAESLRDARKSSKAPAVVWGAASKGVVFSLLMQRAGIEVDYVVDINPRKQGRFLAATGLEVFAPERAITELPNKSTVVVPNGNYLPEIKQMTRDRFNYIQIDGPSEQNLLGTKV